jgi:hypothetical protein
LLLIAEGTGTWPRRMQRSSKVRALPWGFSS